MLHALIMAGGSGTRFWPESRADRPKQLLKLIGDRSLLQATVDRLGTLVPPDRLVLATNERLLDAVRQQLPQLPADALIAEPCKRDTAPAIGLAAHVLLRRDPDATMVVLPADHVIRPDEAFRQALSLGAELVQDSPRRLITFGIRPTYPAETFGYIERGPQLTAPPDAVAPVYRVLRFREKPSAEVARQYLQQGTFYWNAGIFVWKAATILEELERRRPEMAAHLKAIADAWETPQARDVLVREFSAIEGVSIDYAVMEHAEDVAVVEAPFEWDDLGSWQALARLHGCDADGNTILARHLGLDTNDCIIRGPDDHLIVTLGLKDCLVVHTPDATLVADRRREESIRRLVGLLEERGWTEFL